MQKLCRSDGSVIKRIYEQNYSSCADFTKVWNFKSKGNYSLNVAWSGHGNYTVHHISVFCRRFKQTFKIKASSCSMSRTRNVIKRTIICRFSYQLSTVHHSHICVRSASWISLQSFNLLYDFKARDDETKDNVDSAQKQRLRN